MRKISVVTMEDWMERWKARELMEFDGSGGGEMWMKEMGTEMNENGRSGAVYRREA